MAPCKIKDDGIQHVVATREDLLLDERFRAIVPEVETKGTAASLTSSIPHAPDLASLEVDNGLAPGRDYSYEFNELKDAMHDSDGTSRPRPIFFARFTSLILLRPLY